MSKEKQTFSPAFWTANISELLERMAFYAMFVVITLYLSNTLGFNDIQASMISGIFSAGLYFLPMFTGAYADKIGYRRSLIVAFGLLAIGYLLMALFPLAMEHEGLVEYGDKTIFHGLEQQQVRWLVLPIMLVIMVGGSFIKSIISASVARETTTENRARGYSIYYMLVNIGSFSGKSLIDPLRQVIGERAYLYINFFSALLCVGAMLAIFFFYRSVNAAGDGKNAREVWQGLLKVCTNGRLMVLILIVTGFWMVQQQLYATMPKYVIRMAGEGAKPGWIANVNPLFVVLCVNLITKMMAKRTAPMSMAIGMFLIPLSAMTMACGNLIHTELPFGIHPITLMLVLGIIIQALAECFISPRYLEYFSLQAPKGQEALYLGFSNLDSFLSSILGFGLSGILLTKFCPDPALFETHEAWLAASEHAHYIWFCFAGVGMISAVALLIFAKVTARKDQKNETAAK
ncbi:MAG: MFS transporter [Paludibacteraceae bacterium]|nr:MFS transporter [Paludibacteraceae bacterium]